MYKGLVPYATDGCWIKLFVRTGQLGTGVPKQMAEDEVKGFQVTEAGELSL